MEFLPCVDFEVMRPIEILKGKPPVLFMHKMLRSSRDWFADGSQKTLGFLLAEAGYDAWMRNFRGNKFTFEHKKAQESQIANWKLSWHEMAKHDLPARIDYTSEKNIKSKISYADYSQKTVEVMDETSELPEYSKKLEEIYETAPVTYSASLISPIFKFLPQHTKSIKQITDLISLFEQVPSEKLLSNSMTEIFSKNLNPTKFCKNFLFLFSGFNKSDVDMDLLPVFITYTPTEANMDKLYCYSQLIQSGYMKKFDRDFLRQLKSISLVNEVEKLPVPVYQRYGNNDKTSHPTDLQRCIRTFRAFTDYRTFLITNSIVLILFGLEDVKTALYENI